MNTIERITELHVQIEEARSHHDFDDIFSCATQMYELANEIKEQEYQIIACYHLANVHYHYGDYDKSIEMIQEGILHGEVYPFPFYQMVLYNLGGIVYGTVGDEITSVEYTLKSFYIASENKLDFLYIVLNNLGVLFLDLEYYDLAFEYFLKSFKERNINSMDELRVFDGPNIINLLGTCVFMNDMKEYERWLPYYQAYHDHFFDSNVESDYAMYQVILNEDKGEAALTEKVDNMLAIFAENLDYLHIFKDLLKVLERFIQQRYQVLSKRILKELDSMIQKYPKYRKISKLHECHVKYYLTFHDDEGLLDSLMAYFYNKEDEYTIARMNMKQSIMTKIKMEEILYQQNIIIQNNEELRKKVEIEEFTKVLNKSSFIRYVKEELTEMHQDQYVCLCILDIDKFKMINDSCGHMFGDKILLEAVDILKKNIRTIDYIGRIGGDEFCIFLKNVLSLDFVEEKAERIIHDLYNMRIDGNPVKVSASLGICAAYQALSYEQMFEVADRVMYEAKNNGGNQYRIQILER